MSAENHHFIQGGRAICTAPQEAWCRNYPACDCEWYDLPRHDKNEAEPGHEPVPQGECIVTPWVNDLADLYVDDSALSTDDEFPDGPIEMSWLPADQCAHPSCNHQEES